MTAALLPVGFGFAENAVRAEKVFQDQTGGIVWGFDFIDAETMLITLKDGRLLVYKTKSGKSKIVDIPDITESGQGGLLDVLYHAPTNNVYWTFAEERGRNFFSSLMDGELNLAGQIVATSLARGKYQNGDIINPQIIFRSTVIGEGGRHFGSRLVIKDAHLFMTIGERGARDEAQNLSNHNGKILRLDLDGKPAANNPFADNKNALPEIFSFGHRNPQGIDTHPQSGKIFSSEFGPRGGDELNVVRAGKNYGWPEISHGFEYWGPRVGPTAKEGMEQPLIYWTPSISPSGMVFYRGDKIPNWTGDIFLAVLGERHLRRLLMDGEQVLRQEVLFAEMDERVRQVRNSPDGYLYFSTDSGKIFRIISG